MRSENFVLNQQKIEDNIFLIQEIYLSNFFFYKQIIQSASFI